LKKDFDSHHDGQQNNSSQDDLPASNLSSSRTCNIPTFKWSSLALSFAVVFHQFIWADPVILPLLEECLDPTANPVFPPFLLTSVLNLAPVPSFAFLTVMMATKNNSFSNNPAEDFNMGILSQCSSCQPRNKCQPPAPQHQPAQGSGKHSFAHLVQPPL
jgi:hypothetical protein